MDDSRFCRFDLIRFSIGSHAISISLLPDG